MTFADERACITANRTMTMPYVMMVERVEALIFLSCSMCYTFS